MSQGQPRDVEIGSSPRQGSCRFTLQKGAPTGRARNGATFASEIRRDRARSKRYGRRQRGPFLETVNHQHLTVNRFKTELEPSPTDLRFSDSLSSLRGLKPARSGPAPTGTQVLCAPRTQVFLPFLELRTLSCTVSLRKIQARPSPQVRKHDLIWTKSLRRYNEVKDLKMRPS